MSAWPRRSTSDFVVFLDVDWEAKSRKNRQHFLIAELASQLEAHSKILGVERPICPWTNPFSKRKRFIHWLRGKRRLRQAAPNFYVYTPFIFVHNLIASRIPGLTALNRCLLRALLKHVLRQVGLRTDNLIVWIHHPYQLEDIGLVGEKGLVYDIYDDYLASESSLARRQDLKKRERTILSKADWVFVVSKELLKAMHGLTRQLHLVPNGVNINLFSRAMCPETEIPAEISALPHPIIGLVGKVTPRLDFELLAKLVTRHPEWTFVLVGPEEDSARLRSQPSYEKFRDASNVHLLGPKPYESLPGYLKGYDVCIIPYTMNQFNLGSSPLKVYEYLASGKPIVSTDLPAVRPFDGLVCIAQDADEFERHIAAALMERGEELRQKRLATAQENSWERRAKQIITLIGERI